MTSQFTKQKGDKSSVKSVECALVPAEADEILGCARSIHLSLMCDEHTQLLYLRDEYKAMEGGERFGLFKKSITHMDSYGFCFIHHAALLYRRMSLESLGCVEFSA